MSNGTSRSGSNTGQVVMLVVVLLVVVAAVALLQRTLNNAREINDTAANIAQNGQGINLSTDSILSLNQTVEYGDSIEATAEPLVGQLDVIVGLAGTIEAKANSITGSVLAIGESATAINGSGSSINASAQGINGQLGEILAIAGSIRSGVAQININVDDTIGIARGILADTSGDAAGNIVTQARTAARLAECINRALPTGPQTVCN